MNLGPEFSVFGESVPGKMPSPVFEYRFPEKKMCVPGAALPSPGSGGGRGGRATDWGKGCLFPARILITGSAMSLEWVKPSDKTVLTAAVGADKTLKQGVNPADGKAFPAQSVVWPRRYRRIINN